MTTKALKVRWHSPGDWPEVMQIERLSFKEPWLDIDFRRTLRRDAVTCLVAEVDCEVVGYLVYERLQRTTVVMRLAVHPKYRRNGTGAELISRVKNRLKRGRIIADVNEYQVAMQLLLKQANFVRTQTIPDYYGDERDEQGDFYQFEWQPGMEAEDGN